jgi:hypothetical protein
MIKNNQSNDDLRKVKYGFGEQIIIEKGVARVGRSPHVLTIPVELDTKLAYLTGYHLGDGHLSNIYDSFNRKGKSSYEITYADRDLGQITLINQILKEKFHYQLSIKRRDKDNLWLAKSTCKILHWFLHKKAKIPMGERINPRIPNWIYKSNKKLVSFISGFFDAEADVGFKRYKVKGKMYCTIRLQLTQKDMPILMDIKNALIDRFRIHSNINKKWKQNAFILRINARNSVNEFYKKINFKNYAKKEKLNTCLKQIPYKNPRKLK